MNCNEKDLEKGQQVFVCGTNFLASAVIHSRAETGNVYWVEFGDHYGIEPGIIPTARDSIFLDFHKASIAFAGKQNSFDAALQADIVDWNDPATRKAYMQRRWKCGTAVDSPVITKEKTPAAERPITKFSIDCSGHKIRFC